MADPAYADRVRALEGEALDALRRLVAINSFTHDRAGVNRVVEACVELFEPLGFEARRVPSISSDCGDHLFLECGPEDAPGILMVSHNDTVYPPELEERNDFRWREEGGRIYGPGVADIKGGTVLIRMILQALEAESPELFGAVRWKLLINATEEGGCADFAGLAQPYARTGDLACLVYETGFVTPEGASTIVVSRKGAARFRLAAIGREAHSGNCHEEGASAIWQLARTICEVSEWTDYDRDLTFNVGLVEGGSAVNSVAGRAEARLDVRARSMDVFEEGRARVRALEGAGDVAAAVGDGRCRIEVTELPGYPPWEPSEASDLLGNLVVKLGEELGLAIVPQRRKGASDAAHLCRFLPTIDGLGPVGRHTHCSLHDPDRGLEQESVDRASFVERALLSLRLIERLVQG